MPSITQLHIANIRNLKQVSLEPVPGLNWVTGRNGSGKTSLLEAIHILGRGRSFRGVEWNEVRRDGSREMRVVGKMLQGSGSEVSVGWERVDGTTRIRVGGRDVQTARELAQTTPLQIVHPESHDLVKRGPGYRRRFLDWGVFHVEPGFASAWADYRRALKQRNQGLRTGLSDGELVVWEEALGDAATEMDRHRAEYLMDLRPHLDQEMAHYFHTNPVSISYQRGWREGVALVELLARERSRERKLGYTHGGAHRADLRLYFHNNPAAARLSRGQQKLTILALVVAQIRLLDERTGELTLLLLDDIDAELDQHYQGRVIARIKALPYQSWVTTTNNALAAGYRSEDEALFHVEQGAVTTSS